MNELIKQCWEGSREIDQIAMSLTGLLIALHWQFNVKSDMPSSSCLRPPTVTYRLRTRSRHLRSQARVRPIVTAGGATPFAVGKIRRKSAFPSEPTIAAWQTAV